jgi:DNA sulfur modification protein DndB
MDSKFLINDGQHRKAAIIESIKHDESLANESIPIVFFKDQGLVKSQQMFTDLNKHAVNTSKSLNTLYNSNDELAVVTNRIIKQIDFFETYTEKEKDTLGKFSQKLFMLNNFYNANKMLFGNLDIDDNYDKALKFWKGVVRNIVEWNQLEDKSIKKISLRTDFIVTQGVVIIAFGKLGNYFLTSKIVDYDKYLAKLQKINWMRSNPIWEGKTLVNGKISRRDNHINLTYLQIKELIGIKLTEDELNYIAKNEGKKNE